MPSADREDSVGPCQVREPCGEPGRDGVDASASVAARMITDRRSAAPRATASRRRAEPARALSVARVVRVV